MLSICKSCFYQIFLHENVDLDGILEYIVSDRYVDVTVVAIVSSNGNFCY